MPRPTFTETARRSQLLAVTLDLVAEHGRARLSLQRIADAAGISKAAVLYYFPSKDAVITAAYQSVHDELIGRVSAAVDAAPDAAAAITAYVEALLGHIGADPRRARLMAEALGDRAVTDDRPSSPRRWAALAGLVETAQADGTVRPDLDPRLTAVMIGGIVDSVVALNLEDPTAAIADARPAVMAFLRHALAIT